MFAEQTTTSTSLSKPDAKQNNAMQKVRVPVNYCISVLKGDKGLRFLNISKCRIELKTLSPVRFYEFVKCTTIR